MLDKSVDKSEFVEKTNMKRIFLMILSVIIVFGLAGCGSKYREDDFVGKTSLQIENEYGKFDCIGMPVSADGLYRSTACGYTIREARVGFFGTNPEWLFFISFDENGVAVDTYEGYRPGG